MARNSLAFNSIRNQAPFRLSDKEIRSIHGSTRRRVDLYGENYDHALSKILTKKYGYKSKSESQNLLQFPKVKIESQNLDSIKPKIPVSKVKESKEPFLQSQNLDSIESKVPVLKVKKSKEIFFQSQNRLISQRKNPTNKGISGKLIRNSEQPLLFPDSLLGPIPNKKVGKPEFEKMRTKESEFGNTEVKEIEFEKSEPKKEKMTLLSFSQKITFGWIDIFLNLISNPALLLHGIFIAAFTGLLVYLQKDFYVQAEGKAELVAYSIAIMCELALIIMVFIKSKGWLKALKNLTLGILFVYVGCCLGFSVWQKATEQRVEINSNIFSESESLRLKKSVALAESARTKVSSRDGATAMENARKNVQQAQARLDEYLKSNKKIPETLRVNQEFNVIFQAVLLILLRLIFMGVNAVLSHCARNVWETRDLKLA